MNFFRILMTSGLLSNMIWIYIWNTVFKVIGRVIPQRHAKRTQKTQSGDVTLINNRNILRSKIAGPSFDYYVQHLSIAAVLLFVYGLFKCILTLNKRGLI